MEKGIKKDLGMKREEKKGKEENEEEGKKKENGRREAEMIIQCVNVHLVLQFQLWIQFIRLNSIRFHSIQFNSF